MLVIGIAGGSGSGKTTVVDKIISSLPEGSVSLVPQDAYYKDNGHLPPEAKKKINFDHPSSIEFPLMTDHIDRLISGSTIEMPIYSYVTCARSKETIKVEPRAILILEGILLLTNEELMKRMDIKVYVDAESDERLVRIIERDTLERGRTIKDVLVHYQTFVKPMHLQFIAPSMRNADIIIPRGGENQVGIELLVSRIRQEIEG